MRLAAGHFRLRTSSSASTRVLLAAGTLVCLLFWAGSGAVYRMESVSHA
jgi:hypothetical protein